MFQFLNFQVFLSLVIISSLAVGSSSFADVADIALRQGVGVRGLGMGGAYTALADDSSAIFYNPAGLAEVGLGYTYGYLDADEKLASSQFTLIKLGYLGYGEWGARDAAGNDIKAYATSFGSRNGWLNWGVSYKNYVWNTTGTQLNSWSTDIGFLARLTPEWKVGLIAQDFITGKDRPISAGIRLGVGYQPVNSWLALSSDLEMDNLQKMYGHFGAEAALAKGFALRTGISRSEPTAGLSLNFGTFVFDYAALFKQSGQTIHRFEAGIRFAPEKKRPFSLIKPKEFVLIDLAGALKGGRTEISILGGVKPGLDSILVQIKEAASDSSVDGIMLKLGGLGTDLGGMAIVQELRDELNRARKKGKKIVAYVEGSAVGDEYYLAAVADRIIAPPAAAIGGFGKSIEIVRLKGLFEKFGIEYQVFTQGKYKGAMDPYRDKLSADQKQMVKELVADLYRSLITDLAADRKKEAAEMKKIGDGLVFPARDALAMGLIDEIGYYKNARLTASKLAGGDEKEEASIIEQKEVVPDDEVFLSQVFGISVIEIDGEIVSGQGGENFLFGGRWVGSETIAEYIKKASDDIFTKAIILRVNSPGGDAIAAGEIYDALKYAKEKKKVLIASIGSIGASGGYYIASAADKIVADKSSLTGSIGVIGYLPYYSGLLKKLDMKSEVVKEGEHADMFSGLRKLTSAESASIVKLQAEAYDEFIKAVAAGRKMPEKEVREIAEGRLYTGAQAKEVKLVDQLGSFADAVDLAMKEADLKGEPRLIYFHQPGMFPDLGGGLTRMWERLYN